jgi:hypothetical protein
MNRTLVAALGFSVVVLFGCGAQCPEPIYEGGAQDEAFRAIADAEKQSPNDASKAVTILDPSAGEQLSRAATPPTFRWYSPIRAAEAPVRRSAPRRGLWDRARSVIISDAWAHGTPFTGDLYDVMIHVPEETCPVRVVTGNASWTPSAEVWARIVEGGDGPRIVQIFSAYLRDDRVTEGPYAPRAPLTFEVVSP